MKREAGDGLSHFMAIKRYVNQDQIVSIGKLLWHKWNKTFQNEKLEEKNEL